MSKERLQELLVGKTVARAELNHGTVVLYFTDGTSFEREKTCEGEILATLYRNDRSIILSAKI